jgi:hypothetical protein
MFFIHSCESSDGCEGFWGSTPTLFGFYLLDFPLFLQYLEKLKKEEVSIDWAHRVLISSIRQQRMLKMMGIADERHFRYDDEIEVVQFIASEMQKEGLDLNNEENLDSYLNTKFM